MVDRPRPPAGFDLDEDPLATLPEGFTVDKDPWVPPTDISADEAWTMGLSQGATANLSDEAVARLAAPFTDQSYDQHLRHIRESMEVARAKHPWLFMAGEFMGALLPGIGLASKGFTLAGRAGSALSRLGAAAVEGSGWGGLYGFGSGEGLQDRALKGGIGAGGGAIAGPIAEGVGGGLQRALRPIPGPIASNLSQAKEFGVKPTKGQVSGDVAQQAWEEEARNGVHGDWAQKVMLKRDEENRAALGAASEKIGNQVAGGSPVVDDLYGAGQLVRDSVTARKDQLHAAGQAAYKAVPPGTAFLDEAAIQQLPVMVDAALQPYHRIIQNKLAPFASSAKGMIDDFAKDVKDKGAIDAVQIEQIRQTLNAYKGDPKTPDGNAVNKIKSAFDDWFGDTIDNQLFTGDAQVLDNLRNARKLWAQYLQVARPKQGDDAGKVISKIASGGRDPIEVSNWLLGQSSMGNSGTPVRVLGRIEKMFGRDSDEFNALRQAMWMKLTMQPAGKPGLGPQAQANRFADFLNGKGRAMAEKLYSPEERKLMGRYAATLRMLVPKPEATNPPKSGFAALRGISDQMADMLGLAVYLKTGGVEQGLLARMAVPLIKGGAGYARAKAAIAPPKGPITPGLTSLAGPTGSLTGEEILERLRYHSLLAP